VTVAGCDSAAALPASALAGMSFVGRYVSESSPKCIVPGEVPVYHGAGKSLVLVYEDGAQDALGGANAGAAKGMIARPVLASLGWPLALPVYFAVDMPGIAADLSSFVACAKAFAMTIGCPAGIYGDVNTCTYAGSHGIDFLWQFGSGRAPNISIYQSYPPITLPGGFLADPDQGLVTNFGQWMPDQEDNVGHRLVQDHVNQGWWLVVDDHKAGVPTPTAFAALQAEGIPEVVMSEDELNSLATVQWGAT
jgi:Domain of unknown function (DUF1906)